MNISQEQEVWQLSVSGQSNVLILAEGILSMMALAFLKLKILGKSISGRVLSSCDFSGVRYRTSIKAFSGMAICILSQD